MDGLWMQVLHLVKYEVVKLFQIRIESILILLMDMVDNIEEVIGIDRSLPVLIS